MQSRRWSQAVPPFLFLVNTGRRSFDATAQRQGPSAVAGERPAAAPGSTAPPPGPVPPGWPGGSAVGTAVRAVPRPAAAVGPLGAAASAVADLFLCRRAPPGGEQGQRSPLTLDAPPLPPPRPPSPTVRARRGTGRWGRVWHESHPSPPPPPPAPTPRCSEADGAQSRAPPPENRV